MYAVYWFVKKIEMQEEYKENWIVLTSAEDS